jgi:hypothetical protein
MYPIDEILASQRWGWFKDLWAQKQYQQALLTLFNGMPDITYPLREKAQDGTLLPRGEPSYNRLLEIAVEKWGNYNDLRNWKNVVWREFWHLIQGLAWFPLHYLAYFCVEKLFPHYGFIGFILAWSALVYETSKKEFVEDVAGDGRLNAKNFIDWFVRLSPGIYFLLNLWLN